MTRAERARLLATLGTVRDPCTDTGRRRRFRPLEDSRIAAIVLCALDAGIRPSDALGWRVRDVLRCAGSRTRWEVKPAVRVRGIQTVLPVNVRAMLLVFAAHAIARARITALDDSPFFGGVTLRAVRVQWHALRQRAELPHVTFHELRAAAAPVPKQSRAPALRAVRSVPDADQSKRTRSGTVRTPKPRAARNAGARAQTQPPPPAPE